MVAGLDDDELEAPVPAWWQAAERSASLRTPAATTAKPRPCSRAGADSMAALTAIKWVWLEMSLMAFHAVCRGHMQQGQEMAFIKFVGALDHILIQLSGGGPLCQFFVCAAFLLLPFFIGT